VKTGADDAAQVVGGNTKEITEQQEHELDVEPDSRSAQ
jgi:hypothetical protein